MAYSKFDPGCCCACEPSCECGDYDWFDDFSTVQAYTLFNFAVPGYPAFNPTGVVAGRYESVTGWGSAYQNFVTPDTDSPDFRICVQADIFCKTSFDTNTYFGSGIFIGNAIMVYNLGGVTQYHWPVDDEGWPINRPGYPLPSGGPWGTPSGGCANTLNLEPGWTIRLVLTKDPNNSGKYQCCIYYEGTQFSASVSGHCSICNMELEFNSTVNVGMLAFPSSGGGKNCWDNLTISLDE